MQYGPILPHDADHKYPESEKASKPGASAKTAIKAQSIAVLSRQDHIDDYESSFLADKKKTKKRDAKTLIKAAVNNEGKQVRTDILAGQALAAKLAFDWVFFFGADTIAQQLNESQNG
jgi:hypothetical protein